MKPLCDLPTATRPQFQPTETDIAEAKQYAADLLGSPAVKGRAMKLRSKYRHFCHMAEKKMGSPYDRAFGETIRTYLARARELRNLMEQQNA